MLVRNCRTRKKSAAQTDSYRFDEDRRAAARDAGRRRAAEDAAAVAAKPREAREADADVGVDIADDAAAATTFLLASDAATAAPVLLLLFRRAAEEAAPVPMEPIAIAARIATGAVLRDATREPENEGMREEEKVSKLRRRNRIKRLLRLFYSSRLTNSPIDNMVVSLVARDIRD